MRRVFRAALRFLALPGLAAFGKREIPVGGQAVIEGVLMRGPERWGLSVRTSEGDIRRHAWASRPWSQIRPWNLPLFRGVATMAEMLYTGTKALSLSAEISLGEEESLGTWGLVLSIGAAILAVVGLFVALPLLAADLAERHLGLSPGSRHIVEGLARAGVFIGYIAVIGLWKEIGRVFEYHGAEHKTINAFEAGEEMEPAAIARYSRIHTRCGTSFLLVVVAVSVVVFSLIGEGGILWRVASRVLLLPLVIGISYEIIKWCGKNRKAGRILMWPALWLQYLTTREPDESQIEVAVSALETALGEAPPVQETTGGEISGN
ncbi:MAG: DUF1385 domain-containing protein [Thermovirgaceae bacterium]